jgi:hypothetical protein
VTPNWQHLRRLERKLDRQRRANNPDHYDERGRVKKGKKRWHVSHRQRKAQARRREVYRKLAATRKRSHGQLAHRALALGRTFQLERISYRAWQKTFGRSVGRSAPGTFVALLSRLAARAGGQVVELNTRRAKLSQRCHCGVVVKKPLHQRWHDCACGVSTQRDLYSAYLARFVNVRNLRAEGASGPRRLANCGTAVAGGQPARHSKPTCEWTASAVLLWSAEVWPESERVACDRSASRSSEPECCSQAATQGESSAEATVIATRTSHF